MGKKDQITLWYKQYVHFLEFFGMFIWLLFALLIIMAFWFSYYFVNCNYQLTDECWKDLQWSRLVPCEWSFPPLWEFKCNVTLNELTQKDTLIKTTLRVWPLLGKAKKWNNCLWLCDKKAKQRLQSPKGIPLPLVVLFCSNFAGR